LVKLYGSGKKLVVQGAKGVGKDDEKSPQRGTPLKDPLAQPGGETQTQDVEKYTCGRKGLRETGNPRAAKLCKGTKRPPSWL